MNKKELAQLIKEEVHSLLSSKEIFNSFKKDFKDVVLYAGAYLEGNKIKIYLDNDPNKEKNIINKLVRTKYSDKLKKVRSEDDVMVFKIIKNNVQEGTNEHVLKAVGYVDNVADMKAVLEEIKRKLEERGKQFGINFYTYRAKRYDKGSAGEKRNGGVLDVYVKIQADRDKQFALDLVSKIMAGLKERRFVTQYDAMFMDKGWDGSNLKDTEI